MKPRAMNTVTLGCASVGVSSETSDASWSNDHDTPALDTPFQTFVLTSFVAQSCKNGFADPCAVRMMLGSMNTGIPKPPAVVKPSDAARYSFHRCMATRSSSVKNVDACGS